MEPRIVLLAFAATIAWFVAVGAAVTELAASAIEFSLFVGIPFGVTAGILASVFVVLGFREDASDTLRQLAVTVGWFSVAFLVIWLGAVALQVGMSLALTAGTVLGLAAGLIAYLRVGGVPDMAETM